MQNYQVLYGPAICLFILTYRYPLNFISKLWFNQPPALSKNGEVLNQSTRSLEVLWGLAFCLNILFFSQNSKPLRMIRQNRNDEKSNYNNAVKIPTFIHLNLKLLKPKPSSFLPLTIISSKFFVENSGKNVFG